MRILLAVALIAVLAALNVFFAARYVSLRKQYAVLEGAAGAQAYNAKVVHFATLFVEKVLKAPGEIGFEDRLALENAVRALEDKTVFDAWTAFTQSKTEEEAQDNVKILLGLLMERVRA